MDADGLPLVGPGVDYNKVGPIHQKRTLAFLNHFLIETTSFLNNFATVCDGKLEDMLQRIQRLEASICILENKLASIPGLENVYQESETQDSTSKTSLSEITIKTTPTNNESPKSNEGGLTTAPTPIPVQTITTTEPVKDIVTPRGVPYSKDLRYAKYFKMVNMGVPTGAVKLKMTSEGVDANILDKPDEICPNSPATTEHQRTGDSDDNSDDSSEFSD